MKQITKTYKVYEFSELEDSVKEKVINQYYDAENYSFLGNDLKESLKAYLEEHKIEYSDLELNYSLTCSQGDGLCFTGSFIFNERKYRIEHNSNYYFAKSAKIWHDTNEGDEDTIDFDKPDDFTKIYLELCKKLEREGSSIINYRMNFNEFAEYCEANGDQFLLDGTLFTE